MLDMKHHMNCMQLCLADICKKFNMADYLMFCNGWNFSCNNEKPLAQALYISSEEDKSTYLEEYQGLYTEEISKSTLADNYVFNYLNEKKDSQYEIIIHIDSYDCPWHRGYQKLNIPHYVQIVQLDFEKKIIVCDDPYLNAYLVELSFEHFLSGCETIYLYHCKPVENKLSVDILLDNLYRSMDIKLLKENIVAFADRLLKVKDIPELFDYMDDVYLCNNVRVLKFISDSRYGLSYTLQNLYSVSKEDSIIRLADLFELSGVIFEKINSYYIKLYFRKTDIQNKLQLIHNKLIDISNLETMIYNSINVLQGVS